MRPFMRIAVTLETPTGMAAGVLRPDIDPALLGALLVVLEAGVELMVDLGWSYDVMAVAKLVSRIIGPERKKRAVPTGC
jgi:hypothetical protein